jgi:hypothetical protein
MAANPTCEVKAGAAAYAATTNGVNITPSDTIIIRLADQSDVDSWSIQCITTDDTSSASSVSASLTIDSVAKTATFTAPASGKAYRFQSQVNGGIDRNGIARPSYTTTFCVYTLTSASRRVIAADETIEGDSTFGWIKWMNDLVRNPPAGTATTPGGSVNQFQYGGPAGASFMGATGLTYNPTTMLVDLRANVASIASAQIAAGIITQATMTSGNIVAATIKQATMATGCALVVPVMLGPIAGGTFTYTGTDIVGNGLVDHKPVSVVRNLSTTDATVTPIYAFKPTDEAVTTVVAEVNAVPSGGAAGGSYVRRVMIRMDGGVGTCGTVEASWDSEQTASGVGFTGISVGSGIYIGVSGATGFVNVRGIATGRIKWGATITHTTTSWA